MNSITMCGSIGEPRFREVNTKTGKKEVASFGICQIEGKDNNNNTNFAWYNADMWLPEGSKLKQYLVKGAKVLVVGELRTEKWTKDGVEKSTIKIAVRTLELVGGRAENVTAEQNVTGASPVGTGAEESDDLPF